jgi:hypothetical protein
MKGLGELRVKLDKKVVLLRKLLVAPLHVFVDLLLEGQADDRVHQIQNELPRQAVLVLWFRQVFQHLRILLSFLEDSLDAQGLVLRREQVFDIATSND